MKKKLRRYFKLISIVFLVLSWLLAGWPPVWQNPRIPPKIREVQAAVTYQAKGTFTSGPGALSVPVPAGYQDNDVFLLFVESANQAITTPTGWTQVTNSPQYTGTAAAAGGVRLAVFYKFVSGSQSNVSVADSGNHTTAIIANFRGVDTSSPIHLTAGSVDASATTSLSAPSVMTTIVDTLIVNAIGLDKDANDTNTISSVANANLTNVTEQHDQTYNGGVGGGIAFITGEKVSTGSTGNTTATGDSSTTHAYITIALKPQPNNPPSLTVSQPDGISDTVIAGQSYNITYTLSDPDNVVTAAFYYDTNNTGLDGTAISGACASAPEGTNATCSWNTTGMTPGSYYVYGTTNDGVNPQVSAYSSGQITINAAVVSVSISDGTVTYGMMPANTSKTTLPGELNDMQTATNDGNVTENFNIKTSNAVGGTQWTIGASPGTDVFVHQFSKDSGISWTAFTAADTYQTLTTGIVASGTQSFDLRITVPTASSDYQQKTITITVQAVVQ